MCTVICNYRLTLRRPPELFDLIKPFVKKHRTADETRRVVVAQAAVILSRCRYDCSSRLIICAYIYHYKHNYKIADHVSSRNVFTRN